MIEFGVIRPLLLAGVLALIWARVTITGRDLWPFSAYPMFSRRARLADAVVYRVAFQHGDGQRRWWKPHFFRDAERVGALLAGAAPRPGESAAENAALALRRRVILRHVVRLAALAGDTIEPSTDLVVICRRVDSTSHPWSIDDRIIDVVPRTELVSE
jgi:hypothetical protein